MTTAVVIGGGVVGLCTAISLAKRNIDVVVVDEASLAGAPSWGNIGHIATEQCTPLASWATIRSVPRRLFTLGGPVGLPLSAISTWLPFGFHMMKAAQGTRYKMGIDALTSLLREALPAWQRLDALWPHSSILRSDGHFVIWETEHSAKAGRKAWEKAVKGTTQFRDASTDELDHLKAIAPRTNIHAIRFDNTGKVTDLNMLRKNLHSTLLVLRGSLLTGKVTQLNVKSGRAEIHLAGTEILTPDIVVVCGGVSSANLLKQIGHHVPLIAERGYHSETSSAQLSAHSLPMVFEDRSIVINQFARGLRVAGFVEFANASTPPDPQKWQKLEKQHDELGLPKPSAWRRWMGARPTFPDYLPALGRSSKAANLFYAFGHQHLGLTLAPLTGEYMARLVCEEKQTVDLGRFAIERFD